MRIEGYAAVFGNRDFGGDVILPGAFSKTLRHRSPALLWAHDAFYPIGKISSLVEDDHGLLMTANVYPDRHPRLPRLDSVTGLSIGFRTIDYLPRPGGRDLTEIDLWEVSVVSMPLNPLARFKILDLAAA